jgi:hypothetical protein
MDEQTGLDPLLSGNENSFMHKTNHFLFFKQLQWTFLTLSPTMQTGKFSWSTGRVVSKEFRL